MILISSTEISKGGRVALHILLLGPPLHSSLPIISNNKIIDYDSNLSFLSTFDIIGHLCTSTRSRYLLRPFYFTRCVYDDNRRAYDNRLDRVSFSGCRTNSGRWNTRAWPRPTDSSSWASWISSRYRRPGSNATRVSRGLCRPDGHPKTQSPCHWRTQW